MNWKDKKVCVTGGKGMIGRELIEQLHNLGAIVLCADLPDWDLTKPEWADAVCEGMDYIFHLAGVKGNPKMTKERPVDFMGPMLKFDTNMIISAQKNKIKGFLYTSSIAVENPESDKYPAWAKQTAETLIEAMRIQYPEGVNYCIVRPANVYGRFDNLDRDNLMVISSLIKKAKTEKKLDIDVKGGEQIRDFINARDVARGMIKAMELMPKNPVNLCSGQGVKIKDVALKIANKLKIPLNSVNLNLTLGEFKRVMKLNWNFKTRIGINEGIEEVIDYQL